MSRPRIVVIGSINMDLVIRCANLPLPGETVSAVSAMEVCGGKGANQAVAAARAGGDVVMIGRIGDDAFAERLKSNLSNCGIATQAVSKTIGSSGIAIVAVEESGQNAIMVVPGANGQLTPADVENHRSLLESADLLLVQFEVPMPTVAAAIRIARDYQVPVIVDPAPAPNQWPIQNADEFSGSRPLEGVSLICPNESEASKLTGLTVTTVDQAVQAARILHSQGAATVAVTLAERGVLLFDGVSIEHLPSFAVKAVDTTAAGDAFAGALAVRWIESNDLLISLQFANAAGALATTRHGAQPAIAMRDEIESLLRNQS